MNLYYYCKSSGKIPVIEFLDSLPEQDSARIRHDIGLLVTKGIKDCGLSLRHIEAKLWEIRFKLSAGYRIFYFIITEDLFLLHAYKKQSQKAPDREIKVALKRMEELLS